MTCHADCPCPDMLLTNMRLDASDDGQCLLICCHGRVVAMFSGMGSDVETFEFADAGRVGVEELIGRLAG